MNTNLTSEQRELDNLLTILTDGKYISPERVRELLEKLGIGVTISDEEIKFLRDQMPTKVSKALIKELLKLEMMCDGNSTPILIGIPRHFTIISDKLVKYRDEEANEKNYRQGEKIPLTCENMQSIFQYAIANGKQMKMIRRNPDYVLNHLWRRETATGMLKAFSSNCLRHSKYKTYYEQKKYREKILGPEAIYKIEALESYLAMVFYYLHIDCKKSLFLHDQCRLDTLGSNGNPFYLISYNDSLGITSFNHFNSMTFGGDGLGFARGFSKDEFDVFN